MEFLSKNGEHDSRLDIETDIPPAMRVAFNAFCDLSKRRTELTPIPYSEIKSYNDLMGSPLTSIDVVVVNTVDQSFVEAAQNVETETAASK